MKKSKKIKWVEIARRGKSHPLLVIDSLIDLYRHGYFGKAHQTKWNPENYRQFDNARWYSQEDWKKYKAILVKASQSKKVTLSTYAKEYQKRINNYRQFGNKYKDVDFSKYDNKKLIAVFAEWFEHTKRIWCFAYDYIYINQFLPDIITARVASSEPDVWQQNKYLGILFEADQPSEIRLEKRNLVNITQGIKKRRFNKQQLDKKLQNHLEKFAHLGFYYFQGSAHTLRDLKKRIKEYLSLKPKEFLKMLIDFREQDRNEQLTKRIIKELNLDKKVVLYIKIIKRWGSLSNYVDETYGYVVHHLTPLWQEIAKRFGITYLDFCSLAGEEIITALKKGKLSKKLKEQAKLRQKDHALILKQGKKRVLVGQALKNYTIKEKRELGQVLKVKILNGQSATPGKCQGKVKIVFNVCDVKKVKRGDVLVANSTNPTYVPAMERASAIVTDEGGLLCHAAIVSRELQVPCVVGTKIATRVLKDGDLVEVDATKGVVRKI